MVEVSLLHTTPDTRAITHDDRERVEQNNRHRPVLVDHAEDGKNQGISLKRAMVDAKALPPELSRWMFNCNPKMTAGAFGRHLANFADRARKQRNVLFGHAPGIIDQKDVAAGHRFLIAEQRHTLI